jgi:RNA polymerase sigma-70 factor (ECF subfamily)
VDERAARLLAGLFEAHYDYLHQSLRRLGVQSRDIEDVLHDLFVKVYENLHRYDPTRPERPWLFAFAFRIASDHRRLARHRVELTGDFDDAIGPVPNAEDVAVGREAGRIAEAALATIPLDQRAVFLLYEIDEVPMKAIAESLQIPVNTAYSRLRLAREAFAAAVAVLRSADASQRSTP